MKIEEVGDAVYCITASKERVRFTYSVYLIAEEETILIEPGPAVMHPFILEGMEHLGLKRLADIIPTHIHMDHGGGTGKLAQTFPEATVVVHHRGARYLIDPSRLIVATKRVYGDDFEHDYGPILPIPESRIQAAEDGDMINAGGRELRFIHAPGHAAHHMAILDEETGGLFCGEALGVLVPGSDSSILPSISVGDFDVDEYLSSIEKLKKLQPKVLYYSHGGMSPPDDIFSRLAENTVALRNVILEGLRKGDTIEQIERRIVEHLSDSVQARAEAGMKQIIAGYATFFRKKGMLQGVDDGN
jgi:glyoxylase-like metal-dependent hydrolase (beta-lactamase superfamily II)